MVQTQVVSATPQARLTPYLSIDMFKNHRRRGVQVDNLVPRGTPAEQDAALAEVIESASAWVDNTVLGILAATADTEMRQVNVDRRGYVSIHPRYRPVIALTGFAIGPTPAQLRTLTDLTGAGVDLNHMAVPTSPLQLTSSAGPLQFGITAAPADRQWVQYTYQNGFPVTSLTAAASSGASTIQVADTTGIVPGQTWLTIYALQNRIRVLATAVSTVTGNLLVGTGPGTVTFTPPLASAIPNNPSYPTMVSALPADVIEAVVLVSRAIIKETGGGSVVAGGSRSMGAGEKDAFGAGDDYLEAEEFLHPYLVPWA